MRRRARALSRAPGGQKQAPPFLLDGLGGLVARVSTEIMLLARSPHHRASGGLPLAPASPATDVNTSGIMASASVDWLRFYSHRRNPQQTQRHGIIVLHESLYTWYIAH